jgi:hypothetical protein
MEEFEYGQRIGIYLHNNEDLYFRPSSAYKNNPAWGAHGPVMSYLASMLDATRFVAVLKTCMSFSRSGISRKELDEVYGSGVLPSKGKPAFTKKCHYIGCGLENGIYRFDSSKQDGKGGFAYGYPFYTVSANATDHEIYDTYLKAMATSIELDSN